MSEKKRVNARQKGARAEREFAKWLNENFNDTAKRGIQFKGGTDSPDVESPLLRRLGIHPEVKRTTDSCLQRPTQIISWLEQAHRDAGPELTGIVFHRWNQRSVQWWAIHYTDREKSWYRCVDARVFLRTYMESKGMSLPET